jgi:hypothetical protein
VARAKPTYRDEWGTQGWRHVLIQIAVQKLRSASNRGLLLRRRQNRGRNRVRLTSQLLGAVMEQPIPEQTKQSITRRKMPRLAFYVGCIVLSALAYGVEYHMQQSTNGVIAQVQPQQPGQISDAEKAQLSALLQMNQLITTLGTTLMGALGFLLANRKTGSGARALWAAGASFACVGLSIYFGYNAYKGVINMLQSAQDIGWFDVTHGDIPKERACHFFFFVLGVFFFADFAFNELNQGGAADASRN